MRPAPRDRRNELVGIYDVVRITIVSVMVVLTQEVRVCANRPLSCIRCISRN